MKTRPEEGLAMDLADMCTEIGRIDSVSQVSTGRAQGRPYAMFVVNTGTETLRVFVEDVK